MKKFLSVLAIVMMYATSINAQNLVTKLKEKLTLGIKTEANYSNFILKDMPNTQSDMAVGANVGTFIKFNISQNFAIQEDIMFTYASSDFTQNGAKDTYQYFGAEVPIYLMGQWNTRSGGRFYGGVGAYFGLGFSAKFKDNDLDLYKKYDGNKPFMKRFSNGLAAQLGYEFSNKIQINASYKLGFNILDAEKNNSKMLPQSVSLGIGYSF